MSPNHRATRNGRPTAYQAISRFLEIHKVIEGTWVQIAETLRVEEGLVATVDTVRRVLTTMLADGEVTRVGKRYSLVAVTVASPPVEHRAGLGGQDGSVLTGVAELIAAKLVLRALTELAGKLEIE